MKKVLEIVSVYLPGFRSGGPVRTVSNCIEALGKEFHFDVLTSDRDRGDIEAFKGVRVNNWTEIGSARVRYMSPRRRKISEYRRLIRETRPDLIHLNSFFDPQFTLRPLIAAIIEGMGSSQILIGPRGEFSASALALRSIKKKVYLCAFRLALFHHRVTFHASTETEAQDIRKQFGSVKVCQAKDIGPGRADKRIIQNRSEEVLKVCFISRITPMKNLDFALRALRKCKKRLSFSIYGPIADKRYWDRCLAEVKNMPGNISVEYRGLIQPQNIPEAFAAHDIFLLPTLGENFGHVIPEAISAGTTVIISERTPWGHIETYGAGKVINLCEGEERFAQEIDSFARLSKRQRNERRTRIWEQAPEITLRDEAVTEHRKMFQGLTK